MLEKFYDVLKIIYFNEVINLQILKYLFFIDVIININKKINNIKYYHIN